MFPKKDNLFAIPATVSYVDSMNQEYTVRFIHNDQDKVASLHPTFLTGLEKDGLKTNWDGVRSCLKVGCQVKVDVSQCKDSKWLVFGLYIREGVVLDENSEYSSDIRRGKYSKEFDWMQHFPLRLDEKSSPLKTFESKLADIEDNMISFRNELDTAEKALVEDRESLNMAKIESSIQMNQTFTLEESILDNSLSLCSSGCEHQYEVGVVVISVSEDFLQMVGPLKDIWVKMDVHSNHGPVFVEKSRVLDFKDVKVGDIGTVVVGMCVKCQIDKEAESLIPHLALWIGRDPDIREANGVVVWSENEKMLVQVQDGPPVMFKDCKEGEETGKELIVWAWSTQPGMCAEGVTWIVQPKTDNSDLVTRRDFEVTDTINMKQKVGESDKDSDISFGSISECSEIDRNKSLNSNLSTLLNFTPFKRYNYSGNRDDLESSFQWEDVEKKFQQVLLANDLNDDFDELVKEYEDFYSVSQDSNCFKKQRASNDSFILELSTSDDEHSDSASPLRFELLKSPTEAPETSFFPKRQSCLPLSPIPEEITDTDAVAYTPCRQSRDDSGYSENWSGCSTRPMRKLPSCSAEKPPVSSLFQAAHYKLVLEQFLEFTEFPVDERDDIINLFISSLKKTVL